MNSSCSVLAATKQAMVTIGGTAPSPYHLKENISNSVWYGEGAVPPKEYLQSRL